MSRSPFKTPLFDAACPNPYPNLFPKISIRLGPAWGVIRAVRLQRHATPWPAELEGDVLTVTDPEPGEPAAATLSAPRREAILSRIALVCRALDVPIKLEFEPGLGVHLKPGGEREPFDTRAESRQQDKQQRIQDAASKKQQAARRERRRPAIEALERG